MKFSFNCITRIIYDYYIYSRLFLTTLLSITWSFLFQTVSNNIVVYHPVIYIMFNENATMCFYFLFYLLYGISELGYSSHSAIVSALDFNFERVVEGSILTAGKTVESENLNIIIRAIN